MNASSLIASGWLARVNAAGGKPAAFFKTRGRFHGRE